MACAVASTRIDVGRGGPNLLRDALHRLELQGRELLAELSRHGHRRPAEQQEPAAGVTLDHPEVQLPPRSSCVRGSFVDANASAMAASQAVCARWTHARYSPSLEP